MERTAIQDQIEMKMKGLLSRIYEVENENLKYKAHLREESTNREKQTLDKIEQLKAALENLKKRNADEIAKADEKVKLYEAQKSQVEKGFQQLISAESDADWKQARIDFENLMDNIEGSRDAILKRMKLQLTEIDSKLELWNDMVHEASGETKEEMLKNIELLTKKRDELRAKLDEAEATEEDGAWQDIKGGLTEASSSLSAGISKAWGSFTGRKRAL